MGEFAIAHSSSNRPIITYCIERAGSYDHIVRSPSWSLAASVWHVLSAERSVQRSRPHENDHIGRRRRRLSSHPHHSILYGSYATIISSSSSWSHVMLAMITSYDCRRTTCNHTAHLHMVRLLDSCAVGCCLCLCGRRRRTSEHSRTNLMIFHFTRRAAHNVEIRLIWLAMLDGFDPCFGVSIVHTRTHTFGPNSSARAQQIVA